MLGRCTLCSIMMKGLKHSTSRDDVDNTLNLIEQASVVPDEVLVNTLLDACIRLRDVKRLTSALSAFRNSGAVPSEHAYGTVLRAYGHARALLRRCTSGPAGHRPTHKV